MRLSATAAAVLSTALLVGCVSADAQSVLADAGSDAPSAVNDASDGASSGAEPASSAPVLPTFTVSICSANRQLSPITALLIRS